jgi:CheY-like chemotaxis protein
MELRTRGGREEHELPDLSSVLLVDDDADFRKTMSIWLSDDSRWHVDEAANGEEALRKVDDDVDVLVLDREMPTLSGADVIDRLPETSFRGVVVVVSAYREDSALSTADVAAYLTKPITREEFVAELERHVD